MFWGKNIKSGEVYSFDSETTLLDQNLNITNISLILADHNDSSKYYLKTTDKHFNYAH